MMWKHLWILEKPVSLYRMLTGQGLVVVVQPDLVTEDRVEGVEVVVREALAIDIENPTCLKGNRIFH